MEQPLVSIACITFNQAKYIRQCLDGFVMQITTFPVEIVIHDDASTDGTQDIIMEYVEKYPQFQWKPILQKENQYSKGNGILIPFVYPRCTGKYVALCEGDDYWIDPLKLQKQAEYLDLHPDCGLVHTDFKLTKGNRNHDKRNVESTPSIFDKVLKSNGLNICTLTVLFRMSVFKKLPKLNEGKGWPMGDKPLWYEFAHEADIRYIDEVTGCYRILEKSASHHKDINKMIAFKNAGIEITKFYADAYGYILDNDLYDKNYFEYIIRVACRLDNKTIAADYYKKAKERNQLSGKAKLFYYCTKNSILKALINTYIKI